MTIDQCVPARWRALYCEDTSEDVNTAVEESPAAFQQGHIFLLFNKNEVEAYDANLYGFCAIMERIWAPSDPMSSVTGHVVHL